MILYYTVWLLHAAPSQSAEAFDTNTVVKGGNPRISIFGKRQNRWFWYPATQLGGDKDKSPILFSSVKMFFLESGWFG